MQPIAQHQHRDRKEPVQTYRVPESPYLAGRASAEARWLSNMIGIMVGESSFGLAEFDYCEDT